MMVHLRKIYKVQLVMLNLKAEPSLKIKFWSDVPYGRLVAHSRMLIVFEMRIHASDIYLRKCLNIS